MASVRIEGDAADQARLAWFVEIQPGQPLDPRAVRHVVELFYATGEYADVVVETTPVAGGVKWSSVRVKAPLLSEVRVEGRPPDEARRPCAGRQRLRARAPLAGTAPGSGGGGRGAGPWPSRGYLEARVSESIRPTAG